jgi:ABC-type uncharacterized transport system substrate-binding protein
MGKIRRIILVLFCEDKSFSITIFDPKLYLNLRFTSQSDQVVGLNALGAKAKQKCLYYSFLLFSSLQQNNDFGVHHISVAL